MLRRQHVTPAAKWLNSVRYQPLVCRPFACSTLATCAQLPFHPHPTLTLPQQCCPRGVVVTAPVFFRSDPPRHQLPPAAACRLCREWGGVRHIFFWIKKCSQSSCMCIELDVAGGWWGGGGEGAEAYETPVFQFSANVTSTSHAAAQCCTVQPSAGWHGRRGVT